MNISYVQFEEQNRAEHISIIAAIGQPHSGNVLLHPLEAEVEAWAG